MRCAVTYNEQLLRLKPDCAPPARKTKGTDPQITVLSEAIKILPTLQKTQEPYLMTTKKANYNSKVANSQIRQWLV